MRRHRPLRPSWIRSALVIALCVALAPGLAQAKDEKKDKAAPAGGNAITVAVFPYVNGTEELGATKMMEDVLRTQLKAIDRGRAIFIMPAEVEQRLTDHDQLARIDRINDRWDRTGTIDSTALVGVDSLLMVDAILLVKIKEWENHRVPVVGAGQSHTTISLQFALYDPKTQKILWAKNPREQRFAAEMDASSANINYDETGVIQRKSDNAPPRYEAVANDLVRDAFKKFPKS